MKKEIVDLIANADLQAALARTKQLALDGFTELDTPVVLLQSELEHAKRQFFRAQITAPALGAKQHEISGKLLQLLDDTDFSATSLTAPAHRDIILFLSANPFASIVLELEREMKVISDGLSYFGKRQQYDFRGREHVTPADLQRMMLESGTPRFVHFAGNAVVDDPEFGSGLIFEDEAGQARTIGGKVLCGVFKQFPSVECIVLNTCDSGPTALEIGQAVPFVIGMNAAIYDEAAIEFAVAFYEAVASGNNVPFAFEFACNRLRLSHWPDQGEIPVLIQNGHPLGVVHRENNDFRWQQPGRPMR